MLTYVWPMLKIWRKVKFGPVEFVFSFRRRVPITCGISLFSPIRSSASSTKSVPSAAEIEKDAATQNSVRNFMGTAVVVGAGPGLGHALARKLAREGFDLVLVSRNAAENRELAIELSLLGGKVATVGGDVTDEQSVLRIFKDVDETSGAPTLVVYSLQEFAPGQTVEVSAPAFESAWRHNCLGAFLVGRSSARTMSKAAKGTIVFIGSTSSIIWAALDISI